jgi:hypothetical protein
MVELAARGQAERSDVRVKAVFDVKYGNEVAGITSVRVSRGGVVKLTNGKIRGAGIGKSTVSSRGYSLLVGELYQQAAESILRGMTVLGRRVARVEPLRPTGIVGRRIDDWIVTLSNGLRIPTEVKSSTRAGYFESAVGQISNELRNTNYALFVGFLVSKRIHRIIVNLMKKAKGSEHFVLK